VFSISSDACRDIRPNGLGPGDHCSVAARSAEFAISVFKLSPPSCVCVPPVRKSYRAVATMGKSMATRDTSARKRREFVPLCTMEPKLRG